MTVTETPARTTESVHRDEFDRRDFDQAVELMPGLRSSIDSLCDAGRYGEALAADVHAALIRDVAKLNDDVAPSHALNRAVAEELIGCDEYTDLHRFTQGDLIGAGGGVMSLTKTLCGLLERNADVQDKADAAQQAQDALDEALAGAPGDGEGDGDFESKLEALRAAAADARDALDEAIDEQRPGIAKAVREATEHATEQAEQRAEIESGWDLSPGTAARMDPSERLKLTQRIAGPRFRRIFDKLGLFEAMRLGERDKRFDRLPDEIHDVTLGGELDRLLPEEMVGFAVPELEDDLMMRVLENQARIYELRGTDKAGRGAIVFLGDASSSMGTEKFEWCAAFGIALLRVAKEQGRAFHGIWFKGPGSFERFDFPDPREAAPERMLDFASVAADGGTCFMTPLGEAARLLEDEYLRSGKVEGDVVLATDGEADVEGPWLAEWLATKDRLGFQVYAIAIRASLRTIEVVSDYVGEAYDLASPSATAEVFRRVQR